MPLSAMIGLFITAAYFLAAVFAGWLAPYGMAEVVGGVWEPWSAAHPMGTDGIGRDLLSRMIYGGQTTIFVAAAATLLSFTLGSVLGFAAAVRGGWVDQVLSRLVDLMMSIPSLISALVVLSDYVEAARLRGERQSWIIFREILPNALSPLVAEMGLRFIFMVLFISTLSFLGLGVQPPLADWGGIVKENKEGIVYGIPAALLPAVAIATLAISVNLVADWILNRTASLKGGRNG
jgi:peptide/nickel transport system permease protein